MVSPAHQRSLSQRASKVEGASFSHATRPWHCSGQLAPSNPTAPVFLPIQVLPYSPSGAGWGCFHPQTHLSQPSTPSLLPRPRKD